MRTYTVTAAGTTAAYLSRWHALCVAAELHRRGHRVTLTSRHT